MSTKHDTVVLYKPSTSKLDTGGQNGPCVRNATTLSPKLTSREKAEEATTNLTYAKSLLASNT